MIWCTLFFVLCIKFALFCSIARDPRQSIQRSQDHPLQVLTHLLSFHLSFKFSLTYHLLYLFNHPTASYSVFTHPLPVSRYRLSSSYPPSHLPPPPPSWFPLVPATPLLFHPTSHHHHHDHHHLQDGITQLAARRYRCSHFTSCMYYLSSKIRFVFRILLSYFIYFKTFCDAYG